MNFERACLLFILALLPILFLPLSFLWIGNVLALGILLLACYQRHFLLFILACFLGMSYARVLFFAEELNSQSSQTVYETISIERILKQNLHSSVIIKRENGHFVYVNWRAEITPQLGGIYRAELSLKPISSRLNEGNFNRQRWYIAYRISATATIKKAEQIGKPSNWRMALLQRVTQQTAEMPSQGIILALTFGERAWLSDTYWRTFQQTATAHLIAISGLHITLVFGLGFILGKGIVFLINGITFSLKRRQAFENSYFFAIFIGFLGACFYSFLAGFAIPTTRALIAISLLLSWRFRRRYYLAWQLWIQCVALLLLLDPLMLLSDSFWLSALAVLGLIFWYRFFPYSDWALKTKIAWFWRLIHLQLGIALCFLPVQLYFFEGQNPWAFLANLITVPLYSMLIVPLILFTLFSDNLFYSWGWVDGLIRGSLWLLAPIENAWFHLTQLQQWRLFCFDLFVLALLYWRKQLKTHLSVFIVVGLAIYQSYFWWREWQVQPVMEWVHFDVGQGLAMAFVYEENATQKAVLYDTGASWQGGSMAELEIIPYFKRRGIQLETIIVSHDDNDHSGGILPLLTHYPQAKLILSGQNRYSQTEFEGCYTGQQWQFGALRLKAYFPEKIAIRAKNEDSCVLVGEIGQFRLLLTGDSGVAQERIFSAEIGKIDFLQVGHHGSKTSTSYTLLANTKPDYAIISSGRFNFWKMPHNSVLTRLDEFQIKRLNTAKTGMIQIKFYSDYYQIHTQRHSFQSWYRSYFGVN